jgi:hypothetical protein
MEHNPTGSFTLEMYLPINGKNISLCNLCSKIKTKELLGGTVLKNKYLMWCGRW